MSKQTTIILGTIMLTFSGIASRVIGFLYRIFLSNLIGAKGLGLFQMIFPVLAFFISFSCGGIQTAVSRFVAESKDLKKSFSIFTASIIMSEFLAVIASFIMYFFSNVLAFFLGEPNCAVLLKYASYTIPMTVLHACTVGFYLGLKRPLIPSIAQVLEQVFKLASLFIFYVIFTSKGYALTPKVAVFSLILSEIAGTVYCILVVSNYGISFFSKDNFSNIFSKMKMLFNVSYILTLNRILLTFFQSAEAILIPFMLVKYGLSSNSAITLYGILAGITLPVITFPSAISNSIAMMIMPTIADANVSGNKEKIKITTNFTIWFSLVTGIFCIGFFIFFGDFIGKDIFGHASAGSYIKTLSWLCPLMYMSISFGSILHGLGKTTAAFIHNMAAIIIRLLFLLLLVPFYGIKAYFWGMLLSELITVSLHLRYISKEVAVNFSPVANIIKPVIWLTLSLTTGYIFIYIFRGSSNSHSLLFNYGSQFLCAIIISFIFFSFAYKQWQKFKNLLN